jgi:site-specific DNA-methyltransferase (adenine-specific)
MSVIPKDSIDLVVTSPPYDDLRDYCGYTFNFDAIAIQLYRIIKPGGVVVWVVNDATIDGSETGTSFRQALKFMMYGFSLHDTMIWEKPTFSTPGNNRYHNVFNFMFVLSKGKPKTFNPIKDRPNKYAGSCAYGKNTRRQKDGTIKEAKKRKVYNKLGMRNNVWLINHTGNERPCKEIKHPATFPVKLASDHILSWSNLHDIVLDPMIGYGTTAIAALQNGRNFIGIDVSEEYIQDANSRIVMEVGTNWLSKSVYLVDKNIFKGGE